MLVTRDDDGALHAAYNVCRHRGSQLVPDRARRRRRVLRGVGSLRCPYHSWTYALDGRLLRAPHTEDVGRRAGRVRAAPGRRSTTWGGFVFVHLDAGDAPAAGRQRRPRPTPTLANYALAELVDRARRFSYDVAANWKVLAENYNECYHCGPVHPELCAARAGVRAAAATDLDWDDGIPHREGAWTFTMTGTTDRAPLPGLDEDERIRHKGELSTRT